MCKPSLSPAAERHRALEPGGNFQTSPGLAAYLSSSSPTSPRQQSSKLSLQGKIFFLDCLIMSLGGFFQNPRSRRDL